MTMFQLNTSSPSPSHPVLYSFRRCPYAMRARLAVHACGMPVELRDILLKEKPASMLKASPKATVPVLVMENGDVLEESRDIMYWAVRYSDPDNWYPVDPTLRKRIDQLIEENDGPFKRALDRYKYHVRFPENSKQDYRQEGERFLLDLETRLQNHPNLVGDSVTLADVAIFPFIRQFANSDRVWFDQAPYPNLRRWLDGWTSSEIFLHLMKKRKIWKSGTAGPFFPDLKIVDTY